MGSAAELVVGVENLVSLPEVYLKIRQLIDHPRSNIDDFANVVMLDPGLSARVLKIANSAFFGFAARIETLSRAINLMGISQLHDLVLATSAINAFRKLPADVINMEDFWRESVHCGVVSRLLATHCNVLDSERLFVMGLLHQVGHLIIYAKQAKEAQEVLRREENESRALYLLEREVLGYDYAQVSAALMHAWKLPESFQITVGMHPEPGRVDSFELETAIIHLARQIVHQHELGSRGIVRELAIDPAAWRVTGLSEDVVEPIRRESMRYLLETMHLLFAAPLRKIR